MCLTCARRRIYAASDRHRHEEDRVRITLRAELVPMLELFRT
jgi:hypothetical protein